MVLLTAFVFAASVHGSGAQPAQDPELLLGKYTILGEEVQAVMPSAGGTIPPNALSITHNGWNYWLDENGRFWERYKADGGWSEVKLLFDEAKAVQPKAPWRTKVVVFTRADVAEKGTDGVVRLRRFVLQRRQTQAIHQSIARFASMAEAHSGGQIKVELDVQHEQDWMSFTQGQGPRPFGLDFAREYFSPRINSGDYKSDDGVFRGPYQSVLYVFPLAESEGPGVWVNGSPVGGVGYSNDVSWALFSAWERQVAMQAQAKGYSLQPLMGQTDVASSLTPTMWKNVADPAPPAQDVYLARMKPAEGPKEWSAISADPLAALPRLSRHNIEAATGGDIKWQGLEQEVLSGLSGAYATGNYLFVLSWAADLFGTGIDPAYQPKAIGTADLLNHTYVVFKLASPADHPLNLLKLQGLGVTVKRDTGRIQLSSVDGPIEKVVALDGKTLEIGEGGIPAELAPNLAKVTANVSGVRVERPVVLAFRNVPKATPVLGDSAVISGTLDAGAGMGGLKTSMQADPERGQVLQIVEDDLFRHGRVTLLGRVGGPALFAPRDHPFLEMWVKAKNPEPLQLTIHGDNWKPVRALLFGVLPGETGKLVSGVKDGWQRVIIDLRQIPEAPEQVSAITLDVPENGKRWERRTFAPTVWIDDLRVLKVAEGPVLPLIDPPAKKGDAASADPEERALFAATATAAQADALIALLKDPDQMVAVNAAMAFQRIQDPRALVPLSDLTRSSVRRLSRAALRSLAFQDTDAAWAAIRQALSEHIEDVREVAVELLAARNDPKLAGPFALLYSARSWQTRAAAARAIGKLPGDEAQAILLAFSNETDPEVRSVFINAANPAHPDIENRLLWISVNDPSDHVRAAAAVRMIYSSSDKLRMEGYKVLNDDSRTTRAMVLNHLAGHPREDALTGILSALKDRQPIVRAAALRALARAQGSVTMESLTPVLAERDPLVQRELIGLVNARKLKLPAETITVLRSSVDADVVQLAKEL